MSGTEAEVETIDVVALSEPFDLAAMYADATPPGLRLLRPEEVEDPAAIEFALCWRPGDADFAPYPNLKIAGSIAAGVDAVMACSSLPADAIVTRVRDDAQAAMMAGYAAWAVVRHHRLMDDYQENQRKGVWERSFRPAQPQQVNVGVLGYGLMGAAVARAIAAMGYRVRAAARSARPAEAGIEVIGGPGALREVAAASEILVNVLPLTDATRDVLNADLFAAMPKGAALVQIGRGEHMVEEDLLAALASGQVGSATLDVFRTEPLPEGHPFWTHPAVTITPHKASDTTREEALRQYLENVAALRAGRPIPGAVDRAAGY